jgi:hypothetical protein
MKSTAERTIEDCLIVTGAAAITIGLLSLLGFPIRGSPSAFLWGPPVALVAKLLSRPTLHLVNFLLDRIIGILD